MTIVDPVRDRLEAVREARWRRRLALCALAWLVLAEPAAAQVVERQFGAAGSGDGLFSEPFGIAEDPMGNIYVSDVGNHRIQKFDPDGNFIGWAGRCTGNLQPPPNDNCDVANQRAKGFRCTAATCAGGGPGANPGQFDAPHGVTERFGRLYVADRQNNRIQVLDPATGIPVIPHVGGFGTADGQFQFPYDVTVDSVGNLYVADSGNDRIQKFSPSGTFLAKFGVKGMAPGQLTNPHGIAVDASDDVYVADRGNDRIQKFSPSGDLLAVIGSTGSAEGQLDEPVDVVVDPTTGEIVVGELGNERVQIFTAAGAFSKLMGFGVQNGEDLFQVCQLACQAGTAGSGFGQFSGTKQVALGSIAATSSYTDRVILVDTSGGSSHAFCGNGVKEIGEACDGGWFNSSDCCNQNCTYVTSGSTCRASTGVCDVAETCTGSSGSCPADAYAPSTTTCRTQAGVCDVAEFCTGTSTTCPTNKLAAAGTTCRAVSGTCDVAEVCTGSSSSCPADGEAPEGASCDDGVFCNGADICGPTGSTSRCTVHAGDPCPGADGDGDCAETCDETADACTAADAPDSACADDGNACTTDLCGEAQKAWLGFTAGSGGATSNHDIADWHVEGTGAAYDSFSSTAGLSLVGTASQSGSSIRLTADTHTSAAGAMWHQTPIAVGGGFDLTFSFRITGTGRHGDGFAFVIQNTGLGASALGDIGGGLGYQGLTKSLAVEFDTFQNADEPADGFVSIQTRGMTANTSAQSASLGWVEHGIMDDGDVQSVRIIYVPGTLEVYLNGSSTPNLSVAVDLASIGLASEGTGICEHDAGNAGVPCRDASGVCDVAETCDGTSSECPSDGFVAPDTICRASAGVCDVAETCTGEHGECPDDGFVASGSVCRGTAGVCDVAETCTGATAACPDDGFVASGTTCRGAAGACDVAESCTGASATCPSDALAASGTTCRAAAGACDVAETCSGTSTECPSNALVSSGTTCRAAAGDCDVAETCTGAGASCPIDRFVAPTQACRPSAGVCDVQENCTGSSATCPSDAFESSATVCRESAGDCDPEELCTGGAAACPSDALASSGTVCRAAEICNPAEHCTGTDVACPENVLDAPETPCDDGIFCNGPDTCGVPGTDAACGLHAGNPCPGPDGDGDCAESCDETAETCSAPDAGGSACSDDGNDCTVDRCGGGVGSAWVGFTAGTSNRTSNHDILSWSMAGAAIGYDDFTATDGLSLVGPVSGSNGALRLTSDDATESVGAAWYQTEVPVTAGIDTTFTFRITGDGLHADGLAFVIQGSADGTDAFGVRGSGLGYQDIAHSLAVELDTFRNDGEPSDAFVSVQTRGAARNSSEHSASLGAVDFPSMTDGNVHTVRIVYVPGTLAVYLDGAASPNLSVAVDLTVLDLPTAAGTGTCEHTAGNAGTVCRGASGVCDVEEACTGVATACPADGFASADTTCRAAAGECDVAETCTGSSGACPTDVLVGAETICRDAAGECDQAERCSGTGAACPSDGKEPDGTACTADGNPCSQDVCDGASDACSHPAGNAGRECRPANAAESCDVAEMCTGDSLTCPADTGAADGDADGVCDGEDACTKTGGGGTFLAASKPTMTFTRINSDPATGNDKLTLKGAFNLPAGTAFSAVDPLANGARVVVSSATGEVRFDMTLPGGAYAGAGTRGWKASGNPVKKYQYYDKTGAPLGGITKLQVLDASTREPGQVKVMVLGTNGTYPIVTGDDPVETIVVLGGTAAANAGHCGETAFAAPDCAFNGKGNKLTCKQ